MPYPFSYFQNLLPFRRAFEQRKLLNWPQLLFTWLFLLALTWIPVSWTSLQRTSYPLEQLVPQAYRVFDQKQLDQMAATGLRFEHGQAQMPQKSTWQVGHDWIVLGDKAPQTEGFSWEFQANYARLLQSNQEVARLTYDQLHTQDLANPAAWSQALDLAWFTSNRLVISLFLLALSLGLLSLNFFLVSLGSAVLLYLVSKSRFNSLQGFQEAFHLILYSLGLPTLVTCLLGLLGLDLPTSILVQNSLFLLTLALVFYQTQFRDH
ncbi:hypothetical protein E5983_06800 [Streptococcus danieliae]|uniref:DUF1189 domain-containing protein n=1 Tax=Streptococcus danieliae TaxID=747656 RepID=A0A7X3G906_9STRE|nr:hypothetical protein [Streptococcus danieliae]MVX59343.1 hypothetical protein [Streptococcus danieliae]